MQPLMITSGQMAENCNSVLHYMDCPVTGLAKGELVEMVD